MIYCLDFFSQKKQNFPGVVLKNHSSHL